MSSSKTVRRILVVDDMAAIHEDFKKTLCPTANTSADFAALGAELFGATETVADVTFTLETAFQGEQALQMVRAAVAENRPYDLAFIDMRMPPGWNGLTTIQELRKVDASLPVVTCTAFSDYTAEEISDRIGIAGGYMYIRKPFEPEDVRKIAKSMSTRRAA